MIEDLKFTNVGDYWDEETMVKITDLLHQFEDLFLIKFAEMKGILGDLGEMRIPLKLNVKLVKQCPYQLNLQYKEHVKDNIDMMLDVGIIEPVEESEWISPMVVQDKKTREIKICVDL